MATVCWNLNYEVGKLLTFVKKFRYLRAKVSSTGSFSSMETYKKFTSFFNNGLALMKCFYSNVNF